MLSNEIKYEMSLYLIKRLKEQDIYYIFDTNTHRICNLSGKDPQPNARHLVDKIEKYYDSNTNTITPTEMIDRFTDKVVLQKIVTDDELTDIAKSFTKYNSRRYLIALAELDDSIVDTGFETVRFIPKYKLDEFETHLKDTYFTDEVKEELESKRKDILNYITEYEKKSNNIPTYDYCLSLNYPTSVIFLHFSSVILSIIFYSLTSFDIRLIGFIIIPLLINILLIYLFGILPSQAQTDYRYIKSLQEAYVNQVKYIQFFNVFVSDMREEYFFKEIYF